MAPALDCKQSTCAMFDSPAFFTFPAHNFGQYAAGLTFSLWFKPSADGGAGSTLVDFGKGGDQNNNIAFGRYVSTSFMQFQVYSPRKFQYRMFSPEFSWEVNGWTHLVWTLAPRTTRTLAGDALQADWRLYIDGAVVSSFTGIMPADDVLTNNFIGKSSNAALSSFDGYMDTFAVYGVALSAAEALFLFMVCMYVCVYVCMYACVYVCMYVCLYVYM
jgi:hypothetical protein